MQHPFPVEQLKCDLANHGCWSDLLIRSKTPLMETAIGYLRHQCKTRVWKVNLHTMVSGSDGVMFALGNAAFRANDLYPLAPKCGCFGGKTEKAEQTSAS